MNMWLRGFKVGQPVRRGRTMWLLVTLAIFLLFPSVGQGGTGEHDLAPVSGEPSQRAPFASAGLLGPARFGDASQKASDAESTYSVKIDRVMYLPDEPFHVTDLRYPQISDFETRTVEVLQPMWQGQVLQDRPVIFYVHGGGWVDGYASWYTDVLTPTLVAKQGWVVVNLDYRLTSNQVFLADEHCRTHLTCDPTQATKAAWYDDNLTDVAAAFAWTLQHIQDYGGDPSKVFLFGHSAGGHLVSLFATHDRYRAYRPSIRGVMSLSGLYDLNTVNQFAYPLYDQTFRGGHTDTQALTEASPQTYVRSGDPLPSFLVMHCERDLPSLAEQTITFRQVLENARQDVQWAYFTGYDHVSEMAAVAHSDASVTQAIIRYVQLRSGARAFLPLIYRQG